MEVHPQVGGTGHNLRIAHYNVFQTSITCFEPYAQNTLNSLKAYFKLTATLRLVSWLLHNCVLHRLIYSCQVQQWTDVNVVDIAELSRPVITGRKTADVGATRW
jgi:hypothetical protein